MLSHAFRASVHTSGYHLNLGWISFVSWLNINCKLWLNINCKLWLNKCLYTQIIFGNKFRRRQHITWLHPIILVSRHLCFHERVPWALFCIVYCVCVFALCCCTYHECIRTQKLNQRRVTWLRIKMIHFARVKLFNVVSKAAIWQKNVSTLFTFKTKCYFYEVTIKRKIPDRASGEENGDLSKKPVIVRVMDC